MASKVSNMGVNGTSLKIKQYVEGIKFIGPSCEK
jgi:hypothetical protein